jgi:hypothetical protein
MHGGIMNQRICDSFLAYRGSKPMRDSLLASNLYKCSPSTKCWITIKIIIYDKRHWIIFFAKLLVIYDIIHVWYILQVMESRKTSPLGCTINGTQVERGLVKWGYVGKWGLTPPPLSSFDYATPHINPWI